MMTGIRHEPQTNRHYGSKQSRRVGTGLKAGNFVYFIPTQSEGLGMCYVNNNKEFIRFIANLMLLGFGITITVKK